MSFRKSREIVTLAKDQDRASRGQVMEHKLLRTTSCGTLPLVAPPYTGPPNSGPLLTTCLSGTRGSLNTALIYQALSLIAPLVESMTCGVVCRTFEVALKFAKEDDRGGSVLTIQRQSVGDLLINCKIKIDTSSPLVRAHWTASTRKRAMQPEGPKADCRPRSTAATRPCRQFGRRCRPLECKSYRYRPH
jgi:hypothetical protein